MSGKRKPRTSPDASPSAGATATAADQPAPRRAAARRPVPVAPPVDLALVEAARQAAADAGSPEAAAVRDDQGRTWAAAGISLTGLRLSPVRTAVVNAASGGAARLVAAAVVTDAAAVADVDLALLRELGGPALPVQLVGSTAVVRP